MKPSLKITLVCMYVIGVCLFLHLYVTQIPVIGCFLISFVMLRTNYNDYELVFEPLLNTLYISG